MESPFHKLKIKSKNNEGYPFTEIELDGKPLRGCTAIKWEQKEHSTWPVVTITLLTDSINIESECLIEKVSHDE